MYRLTSFFCVFFTVFSSIAQERNPGQIQGMINDDQGTPLPYTHVINLGKGIGTVSASDGFFSIKADLNDSIRFSFVGYQSLTVVASEAMSDREVKITLKPDFLELPSIWVYANPKYKVPKRPVLPIIRMGQLPEHKNKKPINPGDVTFKLFDNMEVRGLNVPILAPSFTLHGPFTYLSKEEREKRKAEEAYLKTFETLSFAKLMALKHTRDLLKDRYSIDDSELDKIIVMMNLEVPFIQKIQDPQKIFASVDRYVERKVSLVVNHGKP